jgi:hypothetical protein
MTKRAKEITSRYKISQPNKYKQNPECKKHYVDKMVGGKNSMLVQGKCKKCGVTVYQDRKSWEEEKKKRGI